MVLIIPKKSYLKDLPQCLWDDIRTYYHEDIMYKQNKILCRKNKHTCNRLAQVLRGKNARQWIKVFDRVYHCDDCHTLYGYNGVLFYKFYPKDSPNQFTKNLTWNDYINCQGCNKLWTEFLSLSLGISSPLPYSKDT